MLHEDKPDEFQQMLLSDSNWDIGCAVWQTMKAKYKTQEKQ